MRMVGLLRSAMCWIGLSA